MSNQKRAAAHVYTAETLQMLHDGLHKVLPAMIKFVKNGHSKAPTSQLLSYLSETDKKLWSDLEKLIASEDRLSAADGNGSIGEENDNESGQLLRSMFNVFRCFEESRQELHSIVKKIDAREKQLQSEIDDLQDQLNTRGSELLNLQHKLRVMEAKLQASANTAEFYESQAQEKAKVLAQWQRGGTAAIWDKEKDRLLHDANEKEKKHEQLLADTKEYYEKRCEKNEQKIAELEQQLRRGQMKDELSSKAEPRGAIIDGLKKQIYYFARDLLSTGQEMYRMQTDVSGILAGLKRDFRIVHQRFIEDQELSQKHLDKLASWLERLHLAFCEGTIALVRAELPDYYYAVEKEVRPIKIRMASLRLQQSYVDSTEKDDSGDSLATLSACVQELEKEVWELETAQAIQQSKEQQEQATLAAQSAEKHPQLVNERGIVSTTVLIRHFPTLSVEFVKEQYANFKQYDTDNNGVLDLSEMMAIVTKTMGHKFSAKEVVEAMNEVDDDNSQTLDFFEYMKVATNIMKKTGKSAIYSDEELMKNKKQLSKLCVIQ